MSTTKMTADLAVRMIYSLLASQKFHFRRYAWRPHHRIQGRARVDYVTQNGWFEDADGVPILRALVRSVKTLPGKPEKQKKDWFSPSAREKNLLLKALNQNLRPAKGASLRALEYNNLRGANQLGIVSRVVQEHTSSAWDLLASTLQFKSRSRYGSRLGISIGVHVPRW